MITLTLTEQQVKLLLESVGSGYSPKPYENLQQRNVRTEKVEELYIIIKNALATYNPK